MNIIHLSSSLSSNFGPGPKSLVTNNQKFIFRVDWLKK